MSLARGTSQGVDQLAVELRWERPLAGAVLIVPATAHVLTQLGSSRHQENPRDACASRGFHFLLALAVYDAACCSRSTVTFSNPSASSIDLLVSGEMLSPSPPSRRLKLLDAENFITT